MTLNLVSSGYGAQRFLFNLMWCVLAVQTCRGNLDQDKMSKTCLDDMRRLLQEGVQVIWHEVT